MLLYYIRHGKPIYHPDSLTPEGEEQARALLPRMKDINPDRIFVSSSRRAILTAKPTVDLLGKEPVVMDWCNEDRHSEGMVTLNAEGKRQWVFDALRDDMLSPEMQALGFQWYDHPRLADLGCREAFQSFQENCYDWLESLGYRHEPDRSGFRAIRPNDERIALFAHHGVGMALLSSVLDIPYPLVATHFSMGFTGVSIIAFNGEERVTPRLLQLSNDAHLWMANQDSSYESQKF